MGCCQSSPRRNSLSSRFAPAPRVHGESSNAISADAANVAVLPVESHRRRSTTLGEQANRPLRRHVWTSKRPWSRPDLELERQEFFDTRVTGQPDIWRALRMAIEIMPTELDTAQGILDAAGITLPTGDLADGAYDERGNLYQMPEHVVVDPVNLVSDMEKTSARVAKADAETVEESDALSGKQEEKGETAGTYTVRARLSDRGGRDVLVTLTKEQKVEALAKKIQEEAQLHDKVKVRIAYMGHILKEGRTLYEQGWKDGHVVNALVSQ
ncbi:hypothetical protein L228DRAFT_235456 [Xylona heveae TC161]|uniref:Ubiquitin-like domain-containing protein n=1 Tax=Xylona heveae (strain CBS 132557 / TC161) TaxID=1328760 RepID=A0A165JL42_XYLHT|nr:hypothetical protein L228DRAFT_235456 [Xylona heveae TC161]KZF26375.1 hypothetical protein L228DRAFT_235456 [Xylona heveae TC161]